MSVHAQRFGIRNAAGARSSEWVVVWKKKTSDVYLVTRTLGRSMKLSLHASGRCHVRAPDPTGWRGSGPPPVFLDTWSIDVKANYQFPFAVVFPEQELRAAEWRKFPDKGTRWIQAQDGQGIEVGLFLVRIESDVQASLNAKGWHTTIVDAPLLDGRRLIVVAGNATPPPEKLAELDSARRRTSALVEASKEPMGNPRMVLLAGPNESGTRKFVEAAGRR